MYRTICDGVLNTGMAAHPLGHRRLWQLVAFIRSLGVPGDGVGGSRRGELQSSTRSGFPTRILPASSSPGNDWLTYSGTYGSNRHSALGQIDARNVNTLTMRWVHQLVGGTTK